MTRLQNLVGGPSATLVWIALLVESLFIVLDELP